MEYFFPFPGTMPASESNFNGLTFFAHEEGESHKSVVFGMFVIGIIRLQKLHNFLVHLISASGIDLPAGAVFLKLVADKVPVFFKTPVPKVKEVILEIRVKVRLLKGEIITILRRLSVGTGPETVDVKMAWVNIVLAIVKLARSANPFCGEYVPVVDRVATFSQLQISVLQYLKTCQS